MSFLMRFFNALFAAFACLTGAGVWAHPVWPLTVAGHFQAQCVLAGLGLAVLACIKRRFAFALLVLVLAAVSLLQMDLGSTTRFVEPGAGKGTPVRVGALNLFGRSAALDRLAQEHEKTAFDILILTELPGPADAALLARFPGMVHVAGTARQALFGRPSAVILSRTPPEHSKRIRVGTNGFALTVAAYCFDGQASCLTVFALHPPPPLRPDYATRQRAILETLAEKVAVQKGAVLVAGDFNAVSWSPLMRQLQTRSGLKKVACGTRWSPTWLAPVPGFGLELDHLFLKGPVSASHCHVGPFLGSDHWPLFAGILLSRKDPEQAGRE